MKYFLDTEFIEGFHRAGGGFFTKSRNRHHVDLISIGIVAEDGREYHAISSEYNYHEADSWVKEHVIYPLYKRTVNGGMKEHFTIENFHKTFGKSIDDIKTELMYFFKYTPAPGGLPKWDAWGDNIKVYAYFADYDWVLFCSIFGRMIDIPKGMPMFCMDIKQMMEERGLTKEWKREKFPKEDNLHDALADAKFNKLLYEEVIKHKVV